MKNLKVAEDDNEDVRGFAATKSYMHSNHITQTNNIFIDGASDRLFVAAHELFHLLANSSGHEAGSRNLMRTTTSTSNGTGKTKRLLSSQGSAVIANPSGILQNP